MSSRVWAVVPAGGVGARMRSEIPKQYLQIGGRTIIEHTLERLSDSHSVDRIVVGVAKQDGYWQGLTYANDKLAAVVEAGDERVDTVENCLQYIAEQGGDSDWALVHDAARPCVRATEIEVLIQTARVGGEGGILAVPVSDTIKRSGTGVDARRIVKTVPRDDLWRAMTPQLFRVGELLEAIGQARQTGVRITDEASAMEAVGFWPLLVACSPDNIKITLPQDIQFAEMILRAQQQEKL